MGWEDDPEVSPWDADEEVKRPPAAAVRLPVGPKESFMHGSTAEIPFGQKAVAAGSSGVLKLVKALSSNPAYQDLDTSYAGQLKREREKLAESEAEHPNYATAGKLLGGGASMMMPGGFVAGGGKKAQLLERALAAGLNGARYGALHGIGGADDATEALTQGAKEAGAMGLAGVGGELLGAATRAAARHYAPEFAIKAAGRLPKKVVQKFMADPELATTAGQELMNEGVITPFANDATKNTRLLAALDRAGGQMGDVIKKADDYGFIDSDTIANALQKKLEALPTAASSGERAALEDYIAKFKAAYPSIPLDDAAMGRTASEAAGTMVDRGPGVGTARPTPVPPDPFSGLLKASQLHDEMVELGKRINWAKAADPGAAQSLASARGVLGDSLKAVIAKGERAGFPELSGSLANATRKYQALAQFKDALANAAAREHQAPLFSFRDLMFGGLGHAAGGLPGAAAGAMGHRLMNAYEDQVLASVLNKIGGAAPEAASAATKAVSPEVEALIKAIQGRFGTPLGPVNALPAAAQEDRK